MKLHHIAALAIVAMPVNQLPVEVIGRVLAGGQAVCRAAGIRVVEDPLRPRGIASRPFDGEGVPCAPRVLVEDGRVTGWLTNVAIALHPEVEVTITLNIARSADEAERQAVSLRTRALVLDGLRPRGGPR